jgi:hypothetical protein
VRDRSVMGLFTTGLSSWRVCYGDFWQAYGMVVLTLRQCEVMRMERLDGAVGKVVCGLVVIDRFNCPL